MPSELWTKALRNNHIHTYITLFLLVLCSLNLKGFFLCHRNVEELLSIETLLKLLKEFRYVERVS